MANQTVLLIKDDASTPVEYTFYPVTANTGKPLWRTRIPSVPYEGQMTLSVAEEVLTSGVIKRTAVLDVPIMETLGTSGTSAGYQAAPKVAYSDRHVHTSFTHPRAVQADRANSLKMILGFLQGASATSGGGVGSQASSGDAFKGATTPGITFFVNGEIPN
jgi:hypothetical protein